jgi:monofunctional biosynthetic peptidoglycan transglycosylase
VLSVPDVRPLAKGPPRTTAFIELRRREAAQDGRRLALRWSWRALDRISPYLQHAAVLSEDGRFWQHEGVDWDAIEYAAEKNWKRRRFAVGGSTITQQVAKNLYLSPSKNPLRKLREILIARRLDAELSKERVLEIYLNVAEWGDGVFGAEAAARRWFGRGAEALTPVQAARLAVALPNPRERAPSARTPALGRKVARLVEAMYRDGLIEVDARDEALAEIGPQAPGAPVAPVARSGAPESLAVPATEAAPGLANAPPPPSEDDPAPPPAREPPPAADGGSDAR